MRNFSSLVYIVQFISVGLTAQIPAITGWVYNKKTLETIPGAIILDSATYGYVESNSNGYYQYGTKQGDKTLIVVAPGFKTQKWIIEVEASVNKNFFMRPVAENESDSAEEYLSLYGMKPSYYSAVVKHIVESPSVLSVSDPLKYLQFLPGVTGGIEGLAGLTVRGSNPDQNLTMMNGLPLYGNGHLWGFLSYFNPHILKSVDIYRGVAPARYGGRAGGGVLDIQTNGGSAKDWTGKIHTDLLTITAVMDGPLDHRGKVTGAFGIRRSYLDWLIGANKSNALIGNIHDFNARVDYKVDQFNQWNFWIFNGRDKYGIKNNIDRTDTLGRRLVYSLNLLTQWQNTQAGAKLAHEFSSNQFVVFTIGYSRYQYSNLFSLDGTLTQGSKTTSANIQEKLQNSITDFTANADMSYIYNPKHVLRYGSQLIWHNIQPGNYHVVDKTNNSNLDTTYGIANANKCLEWSNYGELDLHPNLGLSINLGMRAWTFITPDKTFIRPEPRIILSQLLEGKKRLQFGFSIANQGLHQLSSVNGILPKDVWFPSSGTFRPQRTTQFSAAYILPLLKTLEFSTEFYYKKFDGITDLTGVDGDPLVKNFWERSILQGTGKSQGLELLCTKKTGIYTGLLSYTYSKTTRTFEMLNDGNPFNYRWDRPHQFKGQITYHVASWLKFNFGFMLMSGNCYSVPTGKYLTTDNKLVFDFTAKNNYRLPTYKRIDIGFTKEIKPYLYRGYREFYGIQIYNALGAQNIFNARLELQQNSNVVTLRGTYAFVFVPTGFYRLEF